VLVNTEELTQKAMQAAA